MSFVGWGAASWIFGEKSANNSLIRIGSETVSVSQFEQERGRQIAQMSKEMQKQIYSDRRTLAYFNQQIIANMATRMLLEQRATELGLVVSPTMVANIIKGSPEFWENGIFNTDRFDAVLDANGTTERGFTDALRRQELREMLLGVISNNLPAAGFVTDALYNSRYAMRRIEYSTIRYDAFSVKGTPNEDDLRLVYAKNPKMQPELRTISYVLVDAKMSDNSSYERGYNSIRSVEDMLVAGDSMKDAAKKMRAQYRTFSPMTIQCENINGKSMGDSILNEDSVKPLFGLEQGMESEIMETKKGFVIFRVEKIDAAGAVPFAERRAELVSLWKKAEQEKQAYARANDLIINKKKLAVSVNVSRTDGAPLEVLNAAFRLDAGVTQIVPAEGVFHVVKMVSESLPKVDAAKKKSLEAEVKNILARQILDDYTNYLHRKYTISPNETMMKKLFN